MNCCTTNFCTNPCCASPPPLLVETSYEVPIVGAPTAVGSSPTDTCQPYTLPTLPVNATCSIGVSSIPTPAQKAIIQQSLVTPGIIVEGYSAMPGQMTLQLNVPGSITSDQIQNAVAAAATDAGLTLTGQAVAIKIGGTGAGGPPGFGGQPGAAGSGGQGTGNPNSGGNTGSAPNTGTPYGFCHAPFCVRLPSFLANIINGIKKLLPGLPAAVYTLLLAVLAIAAIAIAVVVIRNK